MSLPNIQMVMVVMHLINIIITMMRRHWWWGRAKTEQSERVRKCEWVRVFGQGCGES